MLSALNYLWAMAHHSYYWQLWCDFMERLHDNRY